MKFNAGNTGRKWPCGGLSRDQWAMVTLAVLFMPAAALAEINIPLPQPRPAAAPAFDRKDSKQAGQATPAAPEAPPAPSACRLALTDTVAIAPSIPAITGPGACGGEDLVRLEAVVLRDRTRVPVKPAATLRCTTASAIADWIRTDMAPLAEELGSRVSELDNFELVRMPGAQSGRRRTAVRTRARQCARRSCSQAFQWSGDRADRSWRPARSARKGAELGLRALHDRTGTGLGRLPRRSHSSRSRGAPQRLPNLSLGDLRSHARGRAVAAGRTSCGSVAAGDSGRSARGQHAASGAARRRTAGEGGCWARQQARSTGNRIAALSSRRAESQGFSAGCGGRKRGVFSSHDG